VIDMPRFNAKELAILNLLRRTQRPLTTNNISERTRMSWHSADRTLNRLFDLGYVEHGRSYGGVNYWRLSR